MSFPENLRRRRLELGLSQDELALKLGYKSKSSIARLEAGETDVSSSKLKRIALIMNTTSDELIGTTSDSISAKDYKNIVIIQAGGKSTRNMMNIPNQFILVDEKPIVVYVMEAYQKHPDIDAIYISCLGGWESILRSYAKRFGISKLKNIVTGGDTILASTKNSIQSIPDIKKNDRIILQESTRPLITQGLISKLLSSYEKYGSSVLVKAMLDYVTIDIKEDIAKYLDREATHILESPEIYCYSTIQNTLQEAFDKHMVDNNSSMAMLMHKLMKPIHYCESNANNIKIIRQEDVYMFKTLKNIIL